MNGVVTMESSEAPVEAVLRAGLARGDAALASIGPVLVHLLASQDHSLFSDEIVSRVRGMAGDLARQLLVAEAAATGAADPRSAPAPAQAELAERLLAEPRLVRHCHALALEWQLAARLEKRSGLDPVLSPLLQALIASDQAATASIAMAALAAQARFVQNQRRMELPLGELPADLFHLVVGTWIEGTGITAADGPAAAVDRLRRAYDEAAGRIGLLGRLVAGMGAGSRVALEIGHAGAAIFLSGLAAALHHDRDLAVAITQDRLLVRLALSLRAAGLKPREVEEQFLHLHPEATLPEGFELLRADRAASLLAAAGRSVGA